MKWIVYYYDINRNRMDTYNIFEHGSFRKYVIEAIKKYKDKGEFAEQLESELCYYFWSKAEWEIIITPWLTNKDVVADKIDVSDQVMLNWDVFVDYVWENKRELLDE